MALTTLKTKCSVCQTNLIRIEKNAGNQSYAFDYQVLCLKCGNNIYSGDSAVDCDMAVKKEASMATKSKNSIPTHSTGNIKHFAVLKDICIHCGDVIYLGDSKGTNKPMFKVWCNTCGVLYEGNSMQDTYDVFNKRAKSMQKNKTVPSNTNQINASKSTYEQNVLSRKCPSCNAAPPTLTVFNTVGNIDLLALRCSVCGNYFGICTDRNTLIGDYDKITGGKGLVQPETKISSTAKEYTMRVAYEANKKRTTCIACDKPLTLNRIVTPPVMYCPCVENLPKD